MNKNFIGIDEAGRGPWAGPLVVAGIAVHDAAFIKNIEYLTDSKKLSHKKREKIFSEIISLEATGKIQIVTEMISAQEIDKIGIREANRKAMGKIIFALLDEQKQNIIKIDGADNFCFENFDAEYIFAEKKRSKNKKIQKNLLGESDAFVKNSGKNTIQFFIGGDASEIEISAASIVAKVTRDAFMDGVSKDFPHFSFAKHKGYGTKKHYEEILNYGINSLHRKTYNPIKLLISQGKGLR